MLTALDFPSDRVRAIELFASRLVDPQNAATLSATFDFESEREQVRKILERAR